MIVDSRVVAIAEAFAEVLRQWLSREELETVRQRNAAGDERICASHDFCDANMAMLEAFEHAASRAFDMESEADQGLWNEAWALAKRLYLTA